MGTYQEFLRYLSETSTENLVIDLERKCHLLSIETSRLNLSFASLECFMAKDMPTKILPQRQLLDIFWDVSASLAHFHILRLCALWDQEDSKSFSIPTIVAIAEKPEVKDEIIERLSNSFAPHQDDSFFIHLIQKHKNRLNNAISRSKAIANCNTTTDLFQFRDKYLAHNLEKTRREIKNPDQIFNDPKIKNHKKLFKLSVKLSNDLYGTICRTSYDPREEQKKFNENAKLLWDACQFKWE